MKCWKIITLVIGFSCTTALSHAQFRYGVKGGLNVTTVHFNKDLFSPQSLTGYHVGVTSEYIVPKLGIGADLSVLFTRKGFEQRNKYYQQSYLEVPVNFKWRINLPVPFMKAYLNAGPYLSWALGHAGWSVSKSNSVTGTSNTVKITPLNMETGVNVGAGLEFLNYFQVSIHYGWGLSDAYKISYSGTSYAQNRVFMLSGAYSFN